jgi:AraC-like DNA-binding protein
MEAPARVQIIASRWTRDIVALAVAEGADESALWRASRVDPELLGDEVPEQTHLRVWEVVMRALDSPGFPIRVAQRRNVDAYALLGLACKTSETVREALGHLIRFTGVWRSQYRCELQERAGAADLVLEGPTGDLGRRCTNESAVAQILKAIRGVGGDPVRPHRVSFRHEAPADLHEHERFFDCELAFGASRDAISLSTATLEGRLSLADDALSTFLVGQLEALAKRHVSADPLTDKVRGVISSMLAGGTPKLEVVAARLAMSPRTLQRHLASVETSFAQIVDATRHHLATELLRETQRSMAEIAFVLGFSEPSAFHRAFKRWEGTTPTQFRDA